MLADAKRAVRRLVLDRGVPPDAPRLERQDEDVRQPGLAGEHGVGGHHQIAAMRTRIPSGPVFDTAAWRGHVRACGSRRGERRVGGHGSRAAGAARESATTALDGSRPRRGVSPSGIPFNRSQSEHARTSPRLLIVGAILEAIDLCAPSPFALNRPHAEIARGD